MIFHIKKNVYGTFERVLVIIDITMACVLVYFFPTKTMEIIFFKLGIRQENTARGTEFACKFWIGIGTMQPGFVVVFYFELFIMKVAVVLKSTPYIYCIITFFFQKGCF